jgi:hypothetical protein
MRRAIICAGTLLWLVGCGGDSHDGTASNEEPETARAGSKATPAAAETAPQTTDPAANQPAASSTDGQKMSPSTPTQGTPMQGSPMQAVPAQSAPMQGAPMQGTPMQGTQGPAAAQGIAPPEGFKANARGECDLHTQWLGDDFCILPPPPDKGFQLHIGPSNYDNPEAVYLLQPGQETVHTFMATSANEKDIHFYVRQYRMRPGAHHTIVKDKSTGRRLSGSDVNQDHPVGGITAPENAGIGIPLTAHSPITVDHHAMNATDKPLLQEVWVNFWYVDEANVKESTNLLYDPGSVSFMVAPHEDKLLGPYECDITQPGRLISMWGHVHANNVRFSAWRTRQGKRDLIYEAYHWQEPLWLEFTSLAHNPTVDAAHMLDGGWSGVLDLQPGDTLAWECHEVNQQDTTLRFTNKTYDGAMCIIIGELVGTKCMSRSPGIMIDPSIE